MKKVMFLIIMVMSMAIVTMAQCNCNDIFNYRSPNKGFEFDKSSVSGMMESDTMYRYSFNVESGKIYRFSFFVAAVFDANVEFKITSSDGQIVLNLSGLADTVTNRKGALEPVLVNNEMKHPTFDFIPNKPDTYTLEVKTNQMKYTQIKYDWDGNKVYVEKLYDVTGCVTFYVQTKKIPKLGFNI